MYIHTCAYLLHKREFYEILYIYFVCIALMIYFYIISQIMHHTSFTRMISDDVLIVIIISASAKCVSICRRMARCILYTFLKIKLRFASN